MSTTRDIWTARPLARSIIMMYKLRIQDCLVPPKAQSTEVRLRRENKKNASGSRSPVEGSKGIKTLMFFLNRAEGAKICGVLFWRFFPRSPIFAPKAHFVQLAFTVGGAFN